MKLSVSHGDVLVSRGHNVLYREISGPSLGAEAVSAPEGTVVLALETYPLLGDFRYLVALDGSDPIPTGGYPSRPVGRLFARLEAWDAGWEIVARASERPSRADLTDEGASRELTSPSGEGRNRA